MASPIIVGGRKIGRLRASYLLTREAFRFLRADPEMFWVPIIGFLVQLAFLLFIGFFVLAPLGFFTDELVGETPETQIYAVMFLVYIVSAFIVSFVQGVITHIVYVRAHGGDATLGDGFRASQNNIVALFVWACITSTVGIILRIIADKSSRVSQIVAMFLGAAWAVLTYFVVPSIIIDKQSGLTAISHSGSVFKKTWGEAIVINVGTGLVFLCAIITAVLLLGGVWILSDYSVGAAVFLGVIFVILLVILILIASVLDGVLKTLLYIYAHEGKAPSNFDTELLTQILGKKDMVNIYPQGIASGGA